MQNQRCNRGDSSISKKPQMKKPATKNQSVLKLSHIDARAFFLKAESYCNFDLPPYFDFGPVIDSLDKHFSGKSLSDVTNGKIKPSNLEHVNYTIFGNKDGRLGWRPFELIHPALYVALVHQLTEKETWKVLQDRFRKFSSSKKILCQSIPIESGSKKSDKAAQVLEWWHQIEQKSLELSLDYELLYQSDITNCYGSIYTHSISWALHGKDVSKDSKKDSKLIGNLIDRQLQDMSYGQTNGLPQGSTLMDFLAEIVLGYADELLSLKLKAENLSDYRILRYRDDYRVFVHESSHGERVMRCLSEVLADLGLHLNESKTNDSRNIIQSSLKTDKYFGSTGVPPELFLTEFATGNPPHRYLVFLHKFASEHPNSGSLMRQLNALHNKLRNVTVSKSTRMPMIAILTDIARNNPKTYSVCFALISILLANAQKKLANSTIHKIYRKLAATPNSGLLVIWLQRIAVGHSCTIALSENLCEAVNGKKIQLWDSSWLNSKTANYIDILKCIDQVKLKKMPKEIEHDEFSLFPEYE